MIEIRCPNCGSVEWNAVEQFSALTPVRLVKTDDGSVEQEFDARAELAREAATSVTTLYLCGEQCGYSVEPLAITKLGG